MKVGNTKSITFFSGPGLRLAGTVYLPDPDVDLRAGVLFCHGFGTLKEGVPPGLSAYLAHAGYTVLAFDYRGFGGSEGPRGLLSPAEQVEDIVHALEFLAQYPGVDPTRIGLYGTSFGGGVAAIAATRSRRPKALILSVPVVSGSRWLKSLTRFYEFVELEARGYQAIARKALSGDIELVDRFEIMIPNPLALSVYPDKVPMSLETVYHLLHHEPIRIAGDLRMPVLMLCVRDDTLTPFDQMESFFEKLTVPKRLRTFEHGNHWVVYNEALPQVAEETIGWFAQHILPHGAKGA
jgi:hypothetical protein